MTPDAPTLLVTDLRKTYRAAPGADEVEVLRGADFSMDKGSNLVITGPSGSGKSTLLQIIGTLDTPTSGTVDIEGVRPFELDDDQLARFRNRNVGFIFQEHHLLPQYSVLENVLIPSLAFTDPIPGSEERAKELLDRVGLSHRLGHRPAELSGGERQRVAVARALVNQPSLLLCDEPTGSLDPKTATKISDLLLDLHAAEETILIVVTHSMELAARFDRRFDLQEGICVEI